MEINTQGCDKDFFEKVYGVSFYDQFIKGLKALIEYNKQKGEPVSISINFIVYQNPVPYLIPRTLSAA